MLDKLQRDGVDFELDFNHIFYQHKDVVNKLSKSANSLWFTKEKHAKLLRELISDASDGVKFLGSFSVRDAYKDHCRSELAKI